METTGTENSVFCVESVGQDVLLDSRLAIIHPYSGWMAVADVHYGYEITRRAQGGLFPLWGMGAIETRIRTLLDEHQPNRLILLGDIVDGRAGDSRVARWLKSFPEGCEVVCVRGNHDPAHESGMDFVDWHREKGFIFHHGHRALAEFGISLEDEEIEIVGHFHPSISLGDGAGTRLKLPALVKDGTRWVLPAFSPWAGGGRMEVSTEAKFYGCGAGRIIRQ